jgi:protoheme ferro-lyase
MEEIERIFSRQYKRMEQELQDVSVPSVVLTVLSKYWQYCEKDVLRNLKGDRNGKERNFNK